MKYRLDTPIIKGLNTSNVSTILERGFEAQKTAPK